MGHGNGLNKSEALVVLRQIYEVVGESVCVESVSLDNLDSLIVKGDKGYQIKMRCTLDRHSRGSILPILEKRHLALKEENGYVVISKIHS